MAAASPLFCMHPYGNKGADLIETIRLENLAGLGPRLGQGHSGSKAHRLFDTQHGVMTRQNPATRSKPWGTKAWNRPASAAAAAGRLRVHNEAGLRDLLADDSPAAPSSSVRSPRSSRASLATSLAGGSTGKGPTSQPAKARPKSAAAALTGREEMRAKHEKEHQRAMERMRANRARGKEEEERLFQAGWDAIMREENDFVPNVEEFLALKAEDAHRKKASLHRAWEEQVFDRLSEQVQEEVTRRAAADEIGPRWRAAQDQYLAASSRKEAGLFRDIIIESEYDPLVYSRRGVRYSQKGLRDPVKLELQKAADEASAIPGQAMFGQTRVGRDTLEPTLWDRLDATPYGHFNKMMAAADGAPRGSSAQRSRINFDHFNVETGRAVMDRELPKPKRTFSNKR